MKFKVIDWRNNTQNDDISSFNNQPIKDGCLESKDELLNRHRFPRNRVKCLKIRGSTPLQIPD